MLASEVRRRFWGIWTLFLASLALLPVLPHLVPGREHPWHPAQTAVAGFVVALLSLPVAVSTFARREELLDLGEGTPVRALLSLWARCFVIGFLGSVLAYGSASPRAAWPFILAAAVLLVIHAPRHGMFRRPAT